MSGCIPPDELETFALGALPSARAEAIAEHLKGCQTCQREFLPIAVRTSASRQTQFDSPLAARRRVSRDVPVVPWGDTHPAAPATPAPDAEQAFADTHVSGEKAEPSEQHPPLVKGSRLDRYIVLERLGAGGMGEVYAAWDPQLDRKVAVKILRADFAQSPLRKELTLRLVRESQALARLSHPNVVTVHDAGTVDDQVFIAMEFAEGHTLSKWLAESERSWRQVLEIFLLAGEGLAAAHESGLTHRDFKPDNVVVQPNGRVKVMDFGLVHARQAAEQEARAAAAKPANHPDSGVIKRAITQPGSMLGTPAYMSPEALHGKATDARSDLFSFCVALYEGLYGLRPFEGETPAAIAAEIAANRVRPPPRGSTVPRRIHQLLLKGLRAAPGERFRTIRALLVQLGRRRSAQQQLVAMVSLSLVVALLAGLVTVVVIRDRRRCASVGDRLSQVWGPSQRKEAEAAFRATHRPWAQRAWLESAKVMDAYAARWLQLRQFACERQGEADEALGQEIVCLGRRLDDLEAVAQLYRGADVEVVERATSTALSLPPLEACIERRPAPRAEANADGLRAELAQVRARIDAGKYADATTRLATLVERAEAAKLKRVLGEARLLGATLQLRTGHPDDAMVLAEEAVLLGEMTRDDELVARAWVDRVGAAALSGTAPGDVDRWIRHAQASLVRAGSPPLIDASLSNSLGLLALRRGDYTEAHTALTRSVELRRFILGEKHPLVSRTLTNLGAVQRAQGNAAAAVATYRECLAMDEALLDSTHPSVAETLNNLGNALLAQGDAKGATAALERSLALKQYAFGPDSMPVAIALSNLGAARLRAGDTEGAQKALEQALALKELRAGKDASTVAATLLNLSAVFRARGDAKAARALDERALAIRTTKEGDASPGVASALTSLAHSLLDLADPAAAAKLLERALAIRRTPGIDRAEVMALLARSLAADGAQLTRALTLLDDALPGLPEGHPGRAEAVLLQQRLTTGRSPGPPPRDRRGSGR